MSVTFLIEGQEGFYDEHNSIPCSKCGVTAEKAINMQSGTSYCDKCHGFGGPEVDPPRPFELNVANSTASLMLEVLEQDPLRLEGSFAPQVAVSAVVHFTERADAMGLREECRDRVKARLVSLLKIARKAHRLSARVRFM